MRKIYKKIILMAVFLLLTAVGVFASSSVDTESTAVTDSYILSISDITDIQELSASADGKQTISVYILPAGSTITVTSKTDGISQRIYCYNENNKIVRSFSMGKDGKAVEGSQKLSKDSIVYYTVTDSDAKHDFMSIDITEDAGTTSYYFIVEDETITAAGDSGETEESVNEASKVSEEEPVQNVQKTVSAEPADSEILINGVSTKFQAYLINEYNYFKLRDIAKVITGTAKQFEVSWDKDKNAISLITGQPYTSSGDELRIYDNNKNQTGTETQSVVYLDGKEKTFVAYLINDYNYFKLRDLAEAFNFEVGWDGTTKTVSVNTDNEYTD